MTKSWFSMTLDLPEILHLAFFSCISLCSHVVTHSSQISRNFTISPSYPWITHAGLFQWIHGYTSISNNITAVLFILLDKLVGVHFLVKNVESVHHWHRRKTASCNLAPTKTKISPFGSNLTLWGDTKLIQFSHKWIAKCWQVCEIIVAPIISNLHIYVKN